MVSGCLGIVAPAAAAVGLRSGAQGCYTLRGRATCLAVVVAKTDPPLKRLEAHSMAGRTFPLLLQTRNDLTLTVARIVLSLVFLGHGTQKMFGWFGGLGFSRTLEVFEQTMGIPAALTVMAMVAEVFGGLGLLFWTPDASRCGWRAGGDDRGAAGQRTVRPVLHELAGAEPRQGFDTTWPSR